MARDGGRQVVCSTPMDQQRRTLIDRVARFRHGKYGRFKENDDSFYESIGEDQTLNQQTPTMDPHERAMQEESWRADLARLEDEIKTLKTVLYTKEQQAAELKRLLGITPIMEFKQDIQHSFSAIKESESVQKTNEKLHQLGETISSSDAYQKTGAAFKSFGAFASRKLGDIRNSNVFKSVEGKVGGAYSSVKSQIGGSRSTENFEDALRSQDSRESEGVAQ